MTTSKATKLTPLPSVSNARKDGREAAREGFSLESNPWLKVARAGSHKDAWNNGWDSFFSQTTTHAQLTLF